MATTATAGTTAPATTTGDTTTPSGGAIPVTLCPTIQAWSDATVDAVNGFRLASRTLDAAGRKARYAQVFVDQAALHDRLVAALDTMDLPPEVAAPSAAPSTPWR